MIIEFMKIYGVGPRVAKKWYKDGMRSLDDIRKRTDLNDAQRIGLKYSEELKKRVPRSEVVKFEKSIQKVLSDMNEDLEAHVMGSFRRGYETCADVDLLGILF